MSAPGSVGSTQRRPPAHALMLAFAACIILRPVSAHAGRLWIAYEAGADTWRSEYEDFFACVTGATNFNDLIGGFGGMPVTFAGDSVVGHCGTNTTSVCTVTMARCVVNDATFAPMLRNGDTVLYVNTGDCGGWNDRSVNVDVGGATVNIRFGEIGNGGTLRCQTWTGLHEVYEANTNGISADCCSHETHFGGSPHPECAAPSGADPYGRYMLDGCAGRSFWAQTLSPQGHITDLAACTQLTVDSTSICAQSRDVRDRGVCMGGNVVRCSYGLTVEDCQGRGCTDTPTPHCNGFDADCVLEYPATMCSGATADAIVRCANTGDVAWSGDVQIGAVPSGVASPFADPGWISHSTAAASMPSNVAPGSMAQFTFSLDAPTVTSPTAYTLAWGLVQGGVYQPAPSPDMLTMAITVAPCSSDGGVPVDAGGDARTNEAGTSDGALADGRLDAANDGGSGVTQPGCGCRAPRSRSSAGAIALVGLAFAFARRRRTRRSR